MAKRKLSDKLRRRKQPEQKAPLRITNDTVAEHREKILAGGRRFKYPLQYARHKLVVNAIAIASIAVLILLGLGYWQLYVAHNSSTFFYRITQIAPLPVGSVDGEKARYSDYLLNYRTAEYYLSKFDEIKPDSDNGKLQLRYKQRESLDIALADAHSRAIARANSLNVSQDEVDEVLDRLRNAANGQLTKETSLASSQRVLGLSSSDLDLLVRNSLLRTKAAFAVDDEARALKDAAIVELPKHDNDFEKTAEALNKNAGDDAIRAGVSGLISTAANFDGVYASDIAKLKQGEISKPIESNSANGYFIVKVLEKTDTQVSFAFLHIPLHTFTAQMEQLKKDGKIHEYISIDLPDEQPMRKEQ